MESAFIDRLLQVAPELRPVYAEHIADNEELLPHVFMGDVTRAVVAAATSGRVPPWIPIALRYFEDGLGSDDIEVRNVVLVSFVENLIDEPVALGILRPMMGPRLVAAADDICGAG